MAQLKDPQYIISTMHQKGMKYYRVYDSAGKQLDFLMEPDLTVEEAAAKLQNTLNNLEGLITVKLSQKTNAEKGEGAAKGSDLHFTVMLGGGSGANAVQGIGSMNSGDLKALIQEAVAAERQNWEKDERIKRLELELAEAREVNPIAEQILGALPGLFASASGAPAAQALAGVGDEEQAHRQQRLTLAIRKLARHDKQYLEHLEMLGTLAETSPLVFTGAIKKLEGLQ
jgi:hypothetical protein